MIQFRCDESSINCIPYPIQNPAITCDMVAYGTVAANTNLNGTLEVLTLTEYNAVADLTTPVEDLNSPIINISSPREGDKVSRLSLKGSITDNVMLDYAEIYRNGGLVKYMNLADKTETRINYNWRGPRGSHSITIIAVDEDGNEGIKSVNFEIVGRK